MLRRYCWSAAQGLPQTRPCNPERAKYAVDARRTILMCEIFYCFRESTTKGSKSQRKCVPALPFIPWGIYIGLQIHNLQTRNMFGSEERTLQWIRETAESEPQIPEGIRQGDAECRCHRWPSIGEGCWWLEGGATSDGRYFYSGEERTLYLHYLLELVIVSCYRGGANYMYVSIDMLISNATPENRWPTPSMRVPDSQSCYKDNTRLIKQLSIQQIPDHQKAPISSICECRATQSPEKVDITKANHRTSSWPKNPYGSIHISTSIWEASVTSTSSYCKVLRVHSFFDICMRAGG